MLVLWGAVYFLLQSPAKRHEMLVVSLWTSVFGLTEPLFVPAYWDPPSLFDLAHRTGFDVESIIFTFGIAGIGAILYELIFSVGHQRMSETERHAHRHRFHFWVVISGPTTFLVLAFARVFNPIYAVFVAAGVGSACAVYCRPDLARKMFVSGLLFTGLYVVYFLTLFALAPGYVQRVWNLGALSGILIAGIPLEELLFAFSFGLLWSSIYEHVTWRTIQRTSHA